jgi:DNA-directed RNA polymerase specialized sigma subunit
MKKYNIPNYIRYKNDLIIKLKLIEDIDVQYLSQEQLQWKFMLLVENIARKFSTTQQASGVMSINDLIQEGNLSLTKAIRKIDWVRLSESDDQEKTLKSFLSKRIKGGIRRAVDINRGDIRIPEHKLNEIRKNNGKDQKMVAMFFNSMFLSIDANPADEDMVYQIPDKSDPYNETLLNAYLLSLLNKHLTYDEVFVLSKSYGLDGKKWSANDIATGLDIKGVSAYVRVSELKKQAVNKLIDNVDHSQVIDYL